jgi:hypothetical protein
MWPFTKKPDVVIHKHNEWHYMSKCHCGAMCEVREYRTLCDECGCENLFHTVIVRDEWDYYPKQVSHRLGMYYFCLDSWKRPWCNDHVVVEKPEGCQKEK